MAEPLLQFEAVDLFYGPLQALKKNRFPRWRCAADQKSTSAGSIYPRRWPQSAPLSHPHPFYCSQWHRSGPGGTPYLRRHDRGGEFADGHHCHQAVHPRQILFLITIADGNGAHLQILLHGHVGED
jgi:hypothetical protein